MAILARGDNTFEKDNQFSNCHLPKAYAERKLNFSDKEEAEPLLRLCSLTHKGY